MIIERSVSRAWISLNMPKYLMSIFQLSKRLFEETTKLLNKIIATVLAGRKA
jgi:hypothetical protein